MNRKMVCRVFSGAVSIVLMCGCMQMYGCAAYYDITTVEGAGKYQDTAAEKKTEYQKAVIIEGTEKADVPGVSAFTDDFGNTITISSEDRVAVLSGSLADAWVLAGGVLSGVTEDYFEFQEIEIDEALSLGSLKSPDLEKLLDLEIDVAILSGNIAKQVAMQPELERFGIRTAYVEVESFEDYEKLMDRFTKVTGRKDLYEKYVTGPKQEIAYQINRGRSTENTESVKNIGNAESPESVRNAGSADGSVPTVLFLRSYSAGVKAKGSDSMTGQMLADLGCINIADSDAALAADLSMEAIVMADPDYIFVTTMGDQEAGETMMQQMFEEHAVWNTLSAVKNGRYYMLDPELFQNKPNERWGESYRILADILYGGE